MPVSKEEWRAELSKVLYLTAWNALIVGVERGEFCKMFAEAMREVDAEAKEMLKEMKDERHTRQ